MPDLNSDFTGLVPTLRWTEVGNLTGPLDAGEVTYQRDLNNEHYKNGVLKLNLKLRARFKNKFGPEFLPERWNLPHVSVRKDGTLAVMDGGGRVQFAKIKKGASYLVPFLQWEGLTLAQEIAHYGAQRYAKQLSYEDYHTGLQQDVNSDAAAHSRIAAEYGFLIRGRQGRPGSFGAGSPVVVEQEANGDWRETVAAVAQVRDNYPDAAVTNQGYLRAVAVLLNHTKYAEHIQELLNTTDPADITPQGGSGGNNWRIVRDRLQELYADRWPEVNFIA
jgi:hypothetical protein